MSKQHIRTTRRGFAFLLAALFTTAFFATAHDASAQGVVPGAKPGLPGNIVQAVGVGTHGLGNTRIASARATTALGTDKAAIAAFWGARGYTVTWAKATTTVVTTSWTLTVTVTITQNGTLKKRRKAGGGGGVRPGALPVRQNNR